MGDVKRLPTIEIVCEHCLGKVLRIDGKSRVGIIYVPKERSKDRTLKHAVGQDLIKRVGAAKDHSAGPIF